MNLVARLIFYSPSSAKRLFYPHPFTALEHCNFFSTKSTATIHKTRTLSNPTIHNSTQTIKKQAEAPPSVWPKPQPIAYQAKVANSVNLIGIVSVPKIYADCGNFTAIVISLGSLSIPVVFEGDLAHAVASHVKVNDCVSVFGQLRVDPLLNESVGKFHVLAEKIYFVVGFEKSGFDRKLGLSSVAVDIEIDEFGKSRSKNDDDEESDKSVLDRNLGISSAAVDIDIDEFGKSRSKNDDDDDDDGVVVDYNNVSRVEFNGGKGKRSSNERPAVTLYGVEALPLPLPLPQSVVVNNGSWKKDRNEILDSWSDLVKNPLQWWDYRGHKANGLVKEKFPDFKHKETEEPLWISSCPKWMLPEFRRLKFDIKEMKPKQNSDHEESWKNLVSNPEKWWDNREKKQSSKSPDFRHKETGEGLWLNRSPDWVLSKLPSLRNNKHAQILKS